MKLGILTSSRADFGVYVPLLKLLNKEPSLTTELIIFGTHLSIIFGNTITEIDNYGFNFKKHKINTTPNSDNASDISNSIGKTIQSFSNFWEKNPFDLVLAIGDRYEMFAAVTAGIPLNINFAHLHAGETTLGAIDNIFRHSISIISNYLFVSTKKYLDRSIQLKGNDINIFNVGALSIDHLKEIEFFSIKEIKKTYNIDLTKPTVLSTVHPETVSYQKNSFFIKEFLSALSKIINKYQIVFTMPNADTNGLLIRKEIENFAHKIKNIYLFESLGSKGYLSFMKHCSFVIGNSSSGFVDASFFPKWVINLGERQKGRILTPNIFSVDFNEEKILKQIQKIEELDLPNKIKIYGKGDASVKIFNIIMKISQKNY